MFAVMFELAKRVADRSPLLNSTSAASALVMFNTLSVSALTSSREYIEMIGNCPPGRSEEVLRSLLTRQVCCQDTESARSDKNVRTNGKNDQCEGRGRARRGAPVAWRSHSVHAAGATGPARTASARRLRR